MDSSFYRKTNVRRAKALFAFSEEENGKEKEMFLFLKDINFVAPSVDIIMYTGHDITNNRPTVDFRLKEDFKA